MASKYHAINMSFMKHLCPNSINKQKSNANEKCIKNQERIWS